MSDLTVVIPTVPERAGELRLTLAAFAALGIEPIVTETAGEERSPRMHGRTARQAIAAALTDGSTGSILLWEDDVDPSPRLAQLWPALAGWRDVTTLYAAGSTFYSASANAWRRQIAGAPIPMVTRFRVVQLARWFGSQAVLMPSWFARLVVAAPEPDDPARAGLDLVIRELLRQRALPLYVTVPNLAQHRGARSVTSPRYRPHRSECYAG